MIQIMKYLIVSAGSEAMSHNLCVQVLKLKFSQYSSIHTNYIIPHCTTLQYNHNIWHGT